MRVWMCTTLLWAVGNWVPNSVQYRGPCTEPSSPRTAQRRATSTGPKTSVEVLIGPGKFDHYTSHHEWINFGKNEFGICKVIPLASTENHRMLPMFIVPTFASLCPKCKQFKEGFKRFSQSPRWRKLKHYKSKCFVYNNSYSYVTVKNGTNIVCNSYGLNISTNQD